MEKKSKILVIPMIIIGSMFAVLGFALGINAFFVPFMKEAFSVSTTMSYLIMTATFLSFVVFGIPSGLIIKNFGYKKSMMFAFLLMGAGFFLIAPSSRIVSFPLFLLALFVCGTGQALLTGAVNTYVTILGPVESAAKRISVMGICNKFSYAGASFILAGFMDLTNVRLKDTIGPFYLITGIFILLGVLSYFSPLPEIKPNVGSESPTSSSNYASSKTSIFQFPHLLLGVLALFFDMGLETIALGTINDYATILGLPSPENYVWLTSAGMIMGYLLGIMLIPKLMDQNTALKICSLLGLLIIPLVSVFPSNTSICLVAILGLANSLLWPTIWPLAIADLGKYTHVGSSLLVVAMIGGAVLPLLFGFIADVTSYSNGYWVCFPAYLFILYFAQNGSKIRTSRPKIDLSD